MISQQLEPSVQAWPRRAALAAAVLLAVVAVIVSAACLWIVHDAVVLDFDLHRAGRGSLCSWAATLPPDDDEEEAREVCIESLQGVRLSPASLVREPVYLGNHEEQRAWFRDQAALYRGFQNEPVA